LEVGDGDLVAVEVVGGVATGMPSSLRVTVRCLEAAGDLAGGAVPGWVMMIR